MVQGAVALGGGRRLRLGMVGGGRDAFIGAVHRMASRLDDRFVLTAGALSADPDRATASGADLGLPPERTYFDFAQMARAEAAREDGIEAVSIVTPNHLHVPAAQAFLAAGIDVICDKPLSASLTDARALADDVARAGLVFAVTYNNTGHAMVRQARELVHAGELGALRVIQVEYAQGWLSTMLEATGHKQAQWRLDPARSGIGGAVSDIGTHASNLAAYVTGQDPSEICAELSRLVPGRALDDNAALLLRYDSGARGMLWASQVAVGEENGLVLRVYGERAGLVWRQERPNELIVMRRGEAERRVTKSGPDSVAAATRVSRTPAGHPDGYLDAFATIYADAAELIAARREDRAPDPLATTIPGIAEGLAAMALVDAAVRSSEQGGLWTRVG